MKGMNYIMSFLELAICEAENSGDINLETRNELFEILTESSMNPLKKFVERIKGIKETKPTEYDGPEEIKKYIDKHGDDLIEAAKLLEKEPENIRRQQIGWLAGVILFFISSVVTASMSLFVVPIVLSILMTVFSFIYMIITYMRVNEDESVSNDLAKIRTALKKIDKKKLPENYRKKLDKVIIAIDDAETEISSRVKVTKESVLEEIYEAELCGDITPEERQSLIDYMNI